MNIRQVFTAKDVNPEQRSGDYKYCPCCTSRLALIVVEGRHRPVCPGCGFIQFRNPAPAVAVLVISGNQFLLGKRLAGVSQGKWATPSGYIEFEEDFLTAGIREVWEETGLQIKIEAILNVASSFLSAGYHFFSVYLLATVIGGELRSGDDFSDAQWFEFGDALPELAFEEDAHMIARVATGNYPVLPVDESYGENLSDQAANTSR
jgi:NADH pyrophosphatase NudC (nudix superfamily)